MRRRWGSVTVAHIVVFGHLLSCLLLLSVPRRFRQVTKGLNRILELAASPRRLSLPLSLERLTELPLVPYSSAVPVTVQRCPPKRECSIPMLARLGRACPTAPSATAAGWNHAGALVTPQVIYASAPHFPSRLAPLPLDGHAPSCFPLPREHRRGREKPRRAAGGAVEALLAWRRKPPLCHADGPPLPPPLPCRSTYAAACYHSSPPRKV